jgi:nucleoside 2-deoxyribosyltransferase
MPAGKSGHLELGYVSGKGKPTYVLFDHEPERWDVMYQFATGGVFFSLESLLEGLSSRTNVRDS